MSKSNIFYRVWPKGWGFSGFIFLFLLVFGVACSPAKMVPEGEYWLSDTKIVMEQPAPYDMQPDLDFLIKQKANAKMLGWRSLRLDLYNWMGGDQKPLIGPDKKPIPGWSRRQWRRFTNWLAETVGTPPVVYSAIARRQTSDMMREYLKSKGFYDGEVSDSLYLLPLKKSEKLKAKVVYSINPHIPYKIKSFKYEIDDIFMQSFILRDSVNCKLKKGGYFDANVMQEERMRLTDSLRNRGYYKFAKEYIYYVVDSNFATYQVDIRLKIKPYMDRVDGKDVSSPTHPVFSIRRVYIYPNYDPKKAIDEGQAYFKSLVPHDTLGVIFLHGMKEKMKYRPILRGVHVKPLDLYRLAMSDQTSNYLSGLSAVKVVNIAFSEPDDPEFSRTYMGLKPLDCHIYLTTATAQSYTVETEGSYASKDYYALNANLLYRHKNLFRGSEDFNLSFNTSWAYNQSLFADNSASNSSTFNSINYGVDARLSVPRFILPFGFQNFSKRYTPKTNFGLGYDYERRPDFNNKSVKASFGYQWSGNGFITHYLNPIELTATQILNISDTYKDLLLEKNIFADYSDKLISATNYTFVYSGKPNAITKNYAYFRTKIEAAGNIFGAFNQAVTGEKSYNEYLDYSAYHLLNLPFAQYMLTEAEYRYNYELPNGQKVVFRSYGGVGVPYGNFKSMPIQKQFMSGGLNSLRGWLPGYVGPGNYPVTKLDNTTINTISRIQQRGEVKLEANIEYRFKLISMLEGALFVDAGNIWTLSNYNISYINAQKLNEDLSKYQLTDRVQTQFALNNFYNQIALNTGFGARFDFSFFIFRLDFGLKVLDPGDNQIGLFRSGFFDRDIWRLNFGVGYPF